MEIRSFNDNDYEEIARWFEERPDWKAPAKEILSTTGFVAEYNGKKVAAGWLYLTNSPIAWFEWTVTNPFDSPALGLRGLRKIFQHVTKLAPMMNPPVTAIIQVLGSEKLVQFYEKRLGFKKTEDAAMMVWTQGG